ncbi:hypothetical protein [Moritella viscosa]|nr:hypothetical protein [Moritella viscosa]
MNTIFTRLISTLSFNRFDLDITYFSSSRSSGYEYLIMTETDALTINNTELPVVYNNILRYPFASSYAYSTNKGQTLSDFLTLNIQAINGR